MRKRKRAFVKSKTKEQTSKRAKEKKSKRAKEQKSMCEVAEEQKSTTTRCQGLAGLLLVAEEERAQGSFQSVIQ